MILFFHTSFSAMVFFRSIFYSVFCYFCYPFTAFLCSASLRISSQNPSSGNTGFFGSKSKLSHPPRVTDLTHRAPVAMRPVHIHSWFLIAKVTRGFLKTYSCECLFREKTPCPSPIRCFKCQQFGHYESVCKCAAVSALCGQAEHNASPRLYFCGFASQFANQFRPIANQNF